MLVSLCLLDVEKAQEGALMSINRFQRTVR